jgi:hypothetical protein
MHQRKFTCWVDCVRDNYDDYYNPQNRSLSAATHHAAAGDHREKRSFVWLGVDLTTGVISAYVWRLCLEGLCSRRRWVDREHSRYMVIDAWEDDEEAS